MISLRNWLMIKFMIKLVINLLKTINLLIRLIIMNWLLIEAIIKLLIMIIEKLINWLSIELVG